MGRFGCATLAGLLLFLGAEIGPWGGASAWAEEADRPLELSAILGGHFFSGSNALGRSTYAAPDSNLAHSVAVGARFGYALSRYFLLEGEFLAMPTKLAAKDSSSVFSYTGRGHLLFRWPVGASKRFQPFVLLGGGALAVRPDPGLPLMSETLGTFHAGVGLRVNVHKWIGVRLDGRMVLVPEAQSPTFTQDYEVLGSVYARFGFTPDKPTPDKPADVDNDGVPDAEDKCPAVSGVKDNAGCPDTDGDTDGTVDRLDKCPAQSGPTENGGCPDTDGDGDGVVDRLDKCPADVGPKGNKGCPDTDQDSDGIVDRLDRCPAEPETKNGYKDNDGCPDELPADLVKFVGTVQGIKFLPNKAVLAKESLPVLDEAATAMQAHPILRFEISGHTDNVGVPADNMTLSQARADAVKAYLVAKGVDPNRLQTAGFGQDQPVADNKTPAGRAQNRRVEFKLLPPLPKAKAAPGAPATPGAPAAPGEAGQPVAPAAPGAPTAPTAPAAPGTSVAPLAPPPPAPPSGFAPPPPPPAPVAPAPPAVPAPPAAPEWAPPPPPPAPAPGDAWQPVPPQDPAAPSYPPPPAPPANPS